MLNIRFIRKISTLSNTEQLHPLGDQIKIIKKTAKLNTFLELCDKINENSVDHIHIRIIFHTLSSK